MVNHDIFLTRIRWQTATGEFIGDSDHFNRLSVLDFCNYFLNQDIPFKLKFRYCRKRRIRFNLNCYKIVKYLQKELKNRA